MLPSLRVVITAAVLLLSPLAVRADDPPPIGAGVDYLYPRPGRTPVPGAAAIDTFGSETTVSYTIFAPPTQGQVVALRQFAGRRVALLLPPNWIDGGALTRADALHLLDRSDFLYETYMELTGGEPAGQGLLKIAFVDVGPYGGFGWIGAKGVEISSGQWQLDLLRRDRDINGYFVHEMGHNFDVVFGGQSYPGAHAWTYLMDAVMNGLMQGGTAEQVESAFLRSRFPAYLTDPNANWETCVKGGNCAYDRESLWGASGLRFTQLHGVLALRDAHQWARGEPGPPPSGAEAMETLRLKALAAVTQKNLGCYQSAWKWYASAELTDFMAPYGPNPFCADNDGDGATELGGDCNDASAADAPGRTELQDGADNDCNGVVDDLLLAEPSGGDFAEDLAVSHPVRIRGAIPAPSDADAFLLSIPSDLTMRYRFTPLPFFRGWLFFHLPSGGWQTWAYAAAPNAETGEVPLAAGSRKISVEMNAESTPGPYEVILWERTPPWGTAMAPQTAGATARLRAVTSAPAAFDQTPDAIRFWVTGIGFVGASPYAAEATLDWRPAPGTYSYRAIPVRDGVPVAKASPPVTFTVHAQSPTFTDDPLIPRVTRIRAVHFSELRSAIAAARAAAGLPAPAWTQPLTGVIRAAAVQELYASLNEVRAQSGAPALSGAPVSGTPIRAVDLQRLRDALK